MNSMPSIVWISRFWTEKYLSGMAKRTQIRRAYSAGLLDIAAALGPTGALPDAALRVVDL
jgi:hypothetical protein